MRFGNWFDMIWFVKLQGRHCYFENSNGNFNFYQMTDKVLRALNAKSPLSPSKNVNGFLQIRWLRSHNDREFGCTTRWPGAASSF